MAKTKTPLKVPVKNEQEDVINIDLQALLIPISILLSGLMISVSLFLSLRSIGDTVLTSGGVAGVNTTAAPAAAAPTTGQTTIGNEPLEGDKSKATVAVVEFSDYECPFCKLFYQQSYKELIKTYVDTGKVLWVYRDYTAVSAHNPASVNESIAAECVRKFTNDATYFKYHDYLFEHTGSNGDGIPGGQDAYVAEAVSYGIDKTKFVQCLSDADIAAQVTLDQNEATTIGIGGTPGFLIGKLDQNGNVNGVIVSGAQPVATFKQVIDQQLSN